MRWSDELTLLHEETPEKDGGGFAVRQAGQPVTVYANKKSVGFKEFFTALQAGHMEQMKFDVFTVEYDGQTLARHDGKLYRVLRAYIDPKTAGEFTELTLSDLAERGAGVGLPC